MQNLFGKSFVIFCKMWYIKFSLPSTIKKEHRPSPLEKRQKLHPREMVRIWIALLHQEKPVHIVCWFFFFCLRDGRGSNRAAARSAASNQPSGLLLSPRVPTRRNVYRGSCEIERFHGFFCFVSHGCAVAERVRLISRRFKTEKMEFRIDKTSRQVYNRTWKQQGIAAKSVRMPLWIETG